MRAGAERVTAEEVEPHPGGCLPEHPRSGPGDGIGVEECRAPRRDPVGRRRREVRRHGGGRGRHGPSRHPQYDRDHQQDHDAGDLDRRGSSSVLPVPVHRRMALLARPARPGLVEAQCHDDGDEHGDEQRKPDGVEEVDRREPFDDVERQGDRCPAGAEVQVWPQGEDVDRQRHHRQEGEPAVLAEADHEVPGGQEQRCAEVGPVLHGVAEARGGAGQRGHPGGSHPHRGGGGSHAEQPGPTGEGVQYRDRLAVALRAEERHPHRVGQAHRGHGHSHAGRRECGTDGGDDATGVGGREHHQCDQGHEARGRGDLRRDEELGGEGQPEGRAPT